MQVEVRQLWRKAVGIVGDVFAFRIMPHQVVVVGYLAGIAAPLEQVRSRNTFQRKVAFGDADTVGAGKKGAYQVNTVQVVSTEYTERVMVPGCCYPFEVLVFHRTAHRIPTSYR